MRRILLLTLCLLFLRCTGAGAQSTPDETPTSRSVEAEGSAPLGTDRAAAERAAIQAAECSAVREVLGHGVPTTQVERQVQSYRRIDGHADGNRYVVRLYVTVLTDPGGDNRTAELQWSGNPRLMIVLPETLLGRGRVPDPAAETELTRGVVHAGFRTLESSLVAQVRYSAEMGRIIKEADTAAMRRYGAKYQCDVLIVGEAFSEEVPDSPVSGFRSARARVEAKAFLADTGELLCAGAETAGGADFTPLIAGKTALQNAAGLLAKSFIPELEDALKNKSRVIVVRVTGFGSPEQINRIRQELADVPAIKAVEIRNQEPGLATLEADGYLTTTQFLEALLPRRSPTLRVVRSTGQEVEVVVVATPVWKPRPRGKGSARKKPERGVRLSARRS